MKKLIALVFFLFGYAAAGQTAESSKKDSLRDEYVQSYSNMFTAKISVTNKVEQFGVDLGTLAYDIVPNVKLKTKFFGAYRFLSFSVGYAPHFIPGNDDDEKRGKTTVFEINLNLFGRHWVQNINYNKVKGYYIENTGDLVPNWDADNDPHILLPNLKYTGYGGFTGYKFNPNFSFRSIYTQTTRQRKSIGTFMPVLSYRYYIIDDRTILSPTSKTSQKTSTIEAHASLGYFYTLVLNERFYISGGVLAGAGFLRTELITRFYNDDDVEVLQKNPSLLFEGDLAIGYNYHRFFGGIQLKSTYQRYDQDNTNVTNNDKVLSFQVFAGMRFHVFKEVNQWFDRLGVD